MVVRSLRRWAVKLRRGRRANDVSGSKVQIQVHLAQDGWTNAGSAPDDPKLLPKRMRDALARHGGDRVRALDAEGTVVAESETP